MEQRRLAVIDLDGTLVRGNTFVTYFRLGVIQMLTSGRIFTALGIAGMSLLRALRLISHKRLKFYAFKRFNVNRNRFVAATHFNDQVAELIRCFEADGLEVLLVTAAASFYVPWIWNGKYIASDLDSKTEMRGAQKLKAVHDYIAANGLTLYAVVTDHYDDLPLLRAGAERNILVSPSDETLRKTAGIKNLEILA